MTVHLTIGEFSKMTYLSVKALRHYHDVGLLEPAEIDPQSGYRRYGADQIGTAQAIRRFRDLDMPLEEIAHVLGTDDLEARNQLITGHLDRLERALGATQSAVRSLRTCSVRRHRPRSSSAVSVQPAPSRSPRSSTSMSSVPGSAERSASLTPPSPPPVSDPKGPRQVCTTPTCSRTESARRRWSCR